MAWQGLKSRYLGLDKRHNSTPFFAFHSIIWVDIGSLFVRCTLFSSGGCFTSLSIVRMLTRYKEAWICYFKASVFTIQYIQQSTPMCIAIPLKCNILGAKDSLSCTGYGTVTGYSAIEMSGVMLIEYTQNRLSSEGERCVGHSVNPLRYNRDFSSPDESMIG